MSGIKRWFFDVETDDYEMAQDGEYVLHDDHEQVVAELRAELAAKSKDADALARVKEIVRLTRKSASDAYEVACHSGNELGQSIANLRVSLLNSIQEAMGEQA